MDTRHMLRQVHTWRTYTWASLLVWALAWVLSGSLLLVAIAAGVMLLVSLVRLELLACEQSRATERELVGSRPEAVAAPSQTPVPPPVPQDESFHRKIFDHTLQFIGVLDPEGRLVRANRAATLFAGIEESSVIGRYFWETPWWSHSEIERERLRLSIRRAASGETVFYETTHPGNNGQVNFVHFSIHPVFDAQGQVEWLIPEGRDITILRHTQLDAEERLHRMQAHYAALVMLTADSGMAGRTLTSAVSDLALTAGRTLGSHVSFWEKAEGVDAFSRVVDFDPVSGVSHAITGQLSLSPEVLESLSPGVLLSLAELDDVPGFVAVREYAGRVMAMSLLLVPVWLREKVSGLLLVEQRERVREWSVDERVFCGVVAEIATRCLINDEQARLVDSLQRSQEREVLVNEANSEGIWDYDMVSGRVQYSARWKTMLGYSPEEIPDERSSWEQLVHPDDIANARKKFEQYARGNMPAYEVEFRMKHRDGGYRWILSRGVGRRDASACLLRVVGSHRDITDQKIAEQALRSSERKFRGLFDSSRDGIAITDMNGCFIEANAAFEKMTGYAVDELRGMTVSDITPAQWQAYEKDTIGPQLLGQGYSGYYEKQYRCRDGSLLDVGLEVSILNDEEGRPLMMWGIVRDVTEAHRNHHEREELMQEISRAHHELEEILYATTHDLRAPLVNIMGFSRRLEKSVKELQEKLQADDVPLPLKMATLEAVNERLPSATHYIQSSAQKMDGLIAGLLHFSRAGRVQTTPVRINMRELLDDVLASLETQVASASALVNIAEDLPDCVADYSQIGQVFSNLLDNAIKYRDLFRPLRLEVSGRVESGEAVYRLADNGIGIAPEHRERIWDLFQRVDTSGEIRGEGLGLPVVRRMVQRNRGRVWVESVPGEGSCFCVALPMAGRVS